MDDLHNIYTLMIECFWLVWYDGDTKVVKKGMLICQKNKRSLNLIGKRKYDFDITLEKQIYSCLCCSYGAKKAFKKLDAKLKFNSYHEWKQYVYNKYRDYHKDKLIDFSRYLNQNMRNIRPLQEFWDLFVSIILTVLFTIGADKFLNFHTDYIKGSLLAFLIIYLLPLIIFVFPILILIRQIIIPIFDNNVEENFFKRLQRDNR